MLKKTVSLLSASAVLAVSLLAWVSTVSAATNDPEFAKALTWMNQNGYTMYNNEDAFRPFSTLRRDEAAKFISTFATTVLSGCRQYEVKGCDFADASDINPSLTSSVKTACEYGLMIGSVSNGARYFYPTANVTKAQFVTTMVRAYEGLKDENGTPWFVNYYNSAVTRGIISKAANPTASVLDKNLTRYEAGLMLYRASSMGCTTGMTTTGTTSTGSTVVTNGTVSVSLATNTNQGVNGTIFVPKTSTNNRVMSIDLVSTNGTARVNTLTLAMDSSLMDRNAAKVSIVDENGVKLTNTRSFNSQDEAILTFTSPLVLDSKVRNFTVMFDFSGSVNQRTVVSVKNVTYSGNTMNISNVMSKYINTVDISSSANRVMISTVGGNTSSAYVSAVSCSNQVYIGETNKLLGRFTLDYTSANNKSAVVTSIRFKSTKSLSAIVANLKLVVGTGTASTNAVIDNRYVTFTFGSGYVMPYGSSKSFYIYGDVVGGQANDAIELYVENDGDVAAYELSANMVSLNTVKGSSTYTTLYCIKEGTNSITRIDGLSATNIPTREQMIQGLVASVNTKSSIKVDKIKLWVTDTNTVSGSVNPANDIENVRLYINGILVDSVSAISTFGGMYYYEIESNRDLNAGANTVEVRFDTKSSATVGNTIAFNLDPSSFVYGSNATYNVSQNNVLLADFNGSANGARLIITNPAINNISNVSTTNVTRVKESNDFVAMSFLIQPNNVRDLNLNWFTLDIYSLSWVLWALNNNFVTYATVVVDGKEYPSVNFSTNGNSVTFNSLNVIIPKWTNKNIIVKVKTTSTHPDANVNDVRYMVSKFDIQDSLGNNVSTINSENVSTYKVLWYELDVAPAITIVCGAGNVPNSSNVITLSGDTTIANFELKARYADWLLQELALANVNATWAAVTSNVLASNYNTSTQSMYFDSSANGLELVASIDGQEIWTTVINNGVAYFTNINNWLWFKLPANTTKNVIIRARVLNKVNWTVSLRILDPNLGTTALNGGTAKTLINSYNGNTSVAWSCTLWGSTSKLFVIRSSNLIIWVPSWVSVTSSLSIGAQNTLHNSMFVVDSSTAFVNKLNYSFNTNAWLTVSNVKVYVNNSELSSSEFTATVWTSNIQIQFSSNYKLVKWENTIRIVGSVNWTATATATEIINFLLSQWAGNDYNAYSSPSSVISTSSIVRWSDDENWNIVYYGDAGIKQLDTTYQLKD